MSYLVDTNIISELARPSCNAGVQEWARTVHRMNLSVVTIEEILYGLTWKPNARLQTWFENFFAQCDVFAVTEHIARATGVLRGRLQAAGQSRAQSDMLIAATASVRGLTVVTRNVANFHGCGVAVLNPFR